MKICFTSDEPKGLESVMSYHFGHCPYYVMVDVEGNKVTKVESISNPFAAEHNAGDLPTYMKEKGVDVIITGGMGPKAQQYFIDYGIKPVTGAYGRVKDVLEEFLNAKIEVREENAIPIENNHKNGDKENEEVERLKKENADLRRQIADLKSRLSRIEEKLDL
ncbi:NifB/NifX family molybdenum-iron cluster-binding protein [Mesoaciditoga sp.]